MSLCAAAQMFHRADPGIRAERCFDRQVIIEPDDEQMLGLVSLRQRPSPLTM
jgi:hypothetical protein